MEESVVSIATVIPVTAGGSNDIRDKNVFLVVAGPEEVEHSWVSVVANCFQNHIISLLNGTKTHVLHGLHKWKGATVSFLCFLLQMLVKCMLLMEVVGRPEAHAENPGNSELWHPSPDVWTFIKKL